MPILPLAIRLAVMAACLDAVPVFANWQIERGTERPSYAVIQPESSDLNIDGVVLACENTGHFEVLQLQIYLSTEGLLSLGGQSQRLKDDSRAEIVIDGRAFPVGIMFADDYVVLADETTRMFPRLSESLLDAMATGTVMVLRFDLLTKTAGQSASFDGEAVIALQPGSDGATISVLRRCATVTIEATNI
jgi:hypothetical protein